MAPKKGQPKRIPQVSPGELNPNRVVAFNLKKARVKKGMKQSQAAAALGWSAANWSNAERSVSADPKRVRNFTVTDLHAFAHLFDLPVRWFLLPPLPGELPDAEAMPEPTALDVLAMLESRDEHHRIGMLKFQYPGVFHEALVHMRQKLEPRKTEADIKREAQLLGEADRGSPWGNTPEQWEEKLRAWESEKTAREMAMREGKRRTTEQ